MAETMIERVARALFKMFRSVPPHGDAWRDYEDDARTILIAMREPTDTMEIRGGAAGNHLNATNGDARDIYAAMIDAALAEQ